MGKINVQFHALPSEIIGFAEYCAKEYALETIFMQFFLDFKAISVNNYDFKSSLEKLERVDRICLCNVKPDILVNSPYEFMEKNPNCLTITIGKFDDQSLIQSFLSGQTDNLELLTIWKKVIKKLNAITLAGVWVINPQNGAKTFYNKYRYTSNAQKLLKDGVKMLPVAGWNYCILNSE